MLEKIFSTKNVLIFIGIMVVFSVGFIWWINYNINLSFEVGKMKSEADISDTNPREKGGQVTEKQMNEYEAEGLNPFGTDTPIEDLDDYYFQEFIHGMSHQKVEADQKWGFYKINEKRIDWLLQGLERNNLEYEENYKEILTRWKNGDFSQAVQDHNVIWRLQGGTIGGATGLLSASEEHAYIKSKE